MSELLSLNYCLNDTTHNHLGAYRYQKPAGAADAAAAAAGGGPVQTPLLFDRVELGVHGSSRVAIVGRNGGGKSTLLRLLHGGLLPTEGEVSRERRCTIGVFDQHFDDQLDLNKSPLKFLRAFSSCCCYCSCCCCC